MKTRVVLTLILLTIILARIIQFGGLNKRDTSIELDIVNNTFLPIQQNLASRIDILLPQPQSGLLSGILLGSKDYLEASLKRVLVNTSTIHIAVASGQNLSMLAGFILVFAPIIGRKRSVTLSLALGMIYSLITGFQIPIIRALIMFFFSFMAIIFGKEAGSSWSLILAALIMLVINPNWLLSVSFQLSFLATLALIEISPLITRNLKFIPSGIKEELGVSLGVVILTFPVIAGNFHQFNLFGFLVNVLVLWTVAPIMILGLLSLIFSFILQPIAVVTAILPNILLTYFVEIVSFFNSLKFSQIFIPRFSYFFWIGYFVILIAVWLNLKNPSKE